jgi:hypothetical protein
MFGGVCEQAENPGPRIAQVVGGRCGERRGDRCGDGVITIAEVLIERLPTDTGTGDDVADGQRIDRTFVGERERRSAQASTHPLSTWIQTVGSRCHAKSVGDFVDN